jgi:hypothetical protein
MCLKRVERKQNPFVGWAHALWNKSCLDSWHFREETGRDSKKVEAK